MSLEVGGPSARSATFQWLDRPRGMPLSSGWAARKEFHFPVGGQDTQDTQDSQDAAGPRVGSRFAPANDQRVARASHRPLTPGCLGYPGGPGKAPSTRSGLRAWPANCFAPSKRQRASRLPSELLCKQRGAAFLPRPSCVPLACAFGSVHGPLSSAPEQSLSAQPS